MIGVATGCTVNDAKNDATPACRGPSCVDPDDPPSSGGPAIELSGGDAGNEEGTAPPEVKAACGLVGDCLPENHLACSSYVPPAIPGEAPEDAGVADDAGAGDGGLAIDGNFGRNPPREPTARTYSCQVSLTEDSEVERACAPAGQQGLNEACTSSMDCAPGMGCVGPAQGGRCLYFCCGVVSSSCAPGYFCAERPLRVEALGDREAPLVPVCERADNCSLGEPFPCTGERCTCGPGLACTLINENGTTACLPPGEGMAGEPCPCAAGFVCSQATSTCVKTCDLDDDDATACGEGGRCQSTPSLPEGWGTCVAVPMSSASRRAP